MRKKKISAFEDIIIFKARMFFFKPSMLKVQNDTEDIREK